MKTLKTLESKKYGSFTVTPSSSGRTRVYFNFSNRGGTACYDLEKGEFVPVKGQVGKATLSWIEENFIN